MSDKELLRLRQSGIDRNQESGQNESDSRREKRKRAEAGRLSAREMRTTRMAGWPLFRPNEAMF